MKTKLLHLTASIVMFGGATIAAAHADTIYTFSNNASVTFSSSSGVPFDSGAQELISGTFTVNSSGGPISSSFTIGGLSFSESCGSGCSQTFGGLSDDFIDGEGPDSLEAILVFANPLNGSGDDSLITTDTEIFSLIGLEGEGGEATSVTGYATPSVTPIPATLPLIATGLSVLGLFGWRRRRKPVQISN